MRHLLLITLLPILTDMNAQVNWRDTSLHFPEIEWNNYSTSYLGEGSDQVPLLVAAIPYNGIYMLDDTDPEHSPLDMSFSGSAYRFRSSLEQGGMALHTYDSAHVYFLAPGIFRSNASRYQFRVIDTDGTIVQDWHGIDTFTGEDFQLNSFRSDFAFLGGYSADWGHCLVAELREKDTRTPLASAVVCWKETRPAILSVLTRDELYESIAHLKNPFEFSLNPTEAQKIAGKRDSAETGSVSSRDSQLVLPAGEDELLVFLRAAIYKKEALEYRLQRNGTEIIPWRSNDSDNNLIWLRHLKAGNYILEMRYSKQRHHPVRYPFRIETPWYESWLFRVTLSILALMLPSGLWLLVQLRRQKRNIAAEQSKQERLALGLRSVYAQLNPHFIFNALASIQGLINRNDIDGANRYLSAFGNLVRHSLTDVESNFIPLSREFATLDTYLSLEKLRFGFQYSIETAPQIHPGALEVPSFLLQPLVENAVKHGISGLRENGMIQVMADVEGSDLIIRVTDNGAGFPAGQNTVGYGLKLTEDRIKLLNEISTGRPIILNRRNIPGTGAQIELVFKNWLL